MNLDQNSVRWYSWIKAEYEFAGNQILTVGVPQSSLIIRILIWMVVPRNIVRKRINFIRGCLEMLHCKRNTPTNQLWDWWQILFDLNMQRLKSQRVQCIPLWQASVFGGSKLLKRRGISPRVHHLGLCVQSHTPLMFQICSRFRALKRIQDWQFN